MIKEKRPQLSRKRKITLVRTSHSIATLQSVAPGLSRQPSLLRVRRPLPEELSGRALHDKVVYIPSRTSGTVRRFGHCCRDMIGIPTERGWPPTTRAQFDAVCGPTGALLIGDAETVAAKILYDNEVLGGISRTTLQMGVSMLPHHKMPRAIELLGTRVAPIVRKELAAAIPARKVASR